MSAPVTVPREALDFFSAKKLRIGFHHLDVFREEHATAFTVAKITELDVLKSIQDSLAEALKKGQSFETWRKAIRPELEKRGWWGPVQPIDKQTGETTKNPVDFSAPHRMRTIYETNMRTAYAAGQWERIQRTKRLLPFLLYQVGPSAVHRPEHLAWHGTLLPADDPWWQTHYTPNGIGCKCHIRQVGQREFDRFAAEGVPSPGIQELDERGRPTGRVTQGRSPAQTQAPPVELRRWVNKRSGEVLMVPKGIDPGFDTNPGAVARAARLKTLLASKESALNAGPPAG